MKKFVSMLGALMLVLAFTACSSNSPEGVVKKYYDCVGKGQYEEAIELLHFKKEMTDKDKQQMASLIREKGTKEMDKKGGISSVEINNVEMSEDGETAVVDATVKYGDGSTKSDQNKVVKVDGEWKIESGK